MGDSSSSDDEPESKKMRKVYNENYLSRKAAQKRSMQRPKVFLTMKDTGIGCCSAKDSTETPGQPPQLFLFDLQCLLVFALRKGWKCICPRWCCMLRPAKASSVVLVVLNDVGVADFQNYKDSFPFLSSAFSENLRVEMVSPSQYNSTVDYDICALPVDPSEMKDYDKWNGFTLPKNGKRVVFPMQARGQPDATSTKADEDKVKPRRKKLSRMQLLLNTKQMCEEKFPMPLDKSDRRFGQYHDFTFTKEQYASVTANSPLYAVDCEMCLTKKRVNELTRVSVISEQGEVLYDELVKPYSPIINYLTRYSGITKEMLDPVTKRIEDVQREIGQLLPPDAILCGQSLSNDLNALKMFHPYVIDTSVIYNLSGNRRFKCGLRKLTSHFLGRSIQASIHGHCSTEDATATIDLVKLKLNNSLPFGDAVLGGANDIKDGTFKLPYLQDAALASSEGKPDAGGQGSTSEEGNTGMSEDLQKLFPLHKNMLMYSLFDFTEKFGISVRRIGPENLIAKHQKKNQVRCVGVSSNKTAYKEAVKASLDCRFTWVDFSAFSELEAEGDAKQKSLSQPSEPPQDSKKEAFQKLDKNLKKLVKKLPEKSLVVVVLTGTGRSHEQHQNAATFLHIT